MRKQPRRWVKKWNERKGALMTEGGVTAQEAHNCIMAMLPQTGNYSHTIEDYDPAKDEFRVLSYHADGTIKECRIPGETVAKVTCKFRAERDALIRKVMALQAGALS